MTDLRSAALAEGMDTDRPSTRVRLRRSIGDDPRPVSLAATSRARALAATPGRAPRGRLRRLSGQPTRRAFHSSSSRRVGRVLVIVASVVSVFGLLLGVSALQIDLISNQRHLDRVRAKLTTSYERQYTLRREETLLRSPQDVADLATSSLGMVPPERATLVAPGAERIGAPPTTAGPTTAGPASASANGAVR